MKFLCYYHNDMDGRASAACVAKYLKKSLDKVGKMVSNNGGKYLKNLEDIPKYLKEFNV